jgi:MmyB-like transcription regulator ligand binding domain
MAAGTANLGEWREHILARLRCQIDISGDAELVRLLQELRDYPGTDGSDGVERDATAVAVPFRLITEAGVLAFFSTTTVFGTPVDITLAELAVEAFFPADQQTADALRRLAG